MPKRSTSTSEVFDKELAEHLRADRVHEDLMSGVRSGVNGTPTFSSTGCVTMIPTTSTPYSRPCIGRPAEAQRAEPSVRQNAMHRLPWPDTLRGHGRFGQPPVRLPAPSAEGR
jgi:hypothetical protein